MLAIWRRFAYATTSVGAHSSLRHRHPVVSIAQLQLLAYTSDSVAQRRVHQSTVDLRKKRKSQARHPATDGDGDDDDDAVKTFDCKFIVAHGVKEIGELEATFMDELNKSLSLKIDLRSYEEFVVKTDDGKQHKLNRLGRIKLVTPLLISIDFADNPTVIKQTKAALEQSKFGVAPRQEGTVLYISVPRITRERRELLANAGTKKLLTEYKKALNEVYSKYDKEVEDHEEAHKIMAELLKEKKAHEKTAIHLIEERRTKLLTEVI